MKRNAKKRSTISRLAESILMVLAGSMLISGTANAVLRDHGPPRATTTDPTLPADFFPDWYRETQDAGGLALGQCIFTDDAGNGPLCLTSIADATPGRFAGNIGPEAFYSAADIIINFNGGNISWLGHLEMAYLTADGEPPAVRNPADPQEIVFSRERIRVDLPTTNDGSCNGTYTIRTPYAVHTFDMEEGNRALFYTDDIAPVPGNFNVALNGHAGPFLKWDVGLDGVNPVTADNPAVTFTTPVGAVRKYIGDPNVPHTFVGSTVPAGPGHLEKGNNNYLEVIPPNGCDLGAGPSAPVFEDQALISGRIWDLPIQDPVLISSATYVRNTSTAALDVWVEASKNQNIVLTASSSDSQQLPSITMPEEIIDGSRTGRYHTHLEFANNQPIPASVTATNLTSNPQSRSTKGVVDAVVITKSVYDPNTDTLCIAAHSGDETNTQQLRLEAPNYGVFTPPTGTCEGEHDNDVVLEKNLVSDFPGGDHRIPPEGILVKSDRGGQEVSHPISLTGVTDASVLAGAVDDQFANIPGTAATNLDLTAAAYGALPGVVKTTASADTTPGVFRIVVVSQPINDLGEQIGSITAPASGGVVTYTAQEGMETQNLSFFYAIQNTATQAVTNVAKVDLSVVKTVPPPVAVQDSQGVFRTSAGASINVLANDSTGLTNTQIDNSSVELVGGINAGKDLATARGTVHVNNNGTLTYTPVGQGGTANGTTDTFSYTVANVGGARSLPVTVRVVLMTNTETVAFQRVRWGGTRWDIRYTSTYAGTFANPAGGNTVLAPVSTCSLIANGAGGALGQINGPVLPAAGANSYVNVGNSPAAVGSNWTVRCVTASGGAANRTGQL